MDKWLWQARFYRTRTLATEMISRGRVRVNAKLVKKPGAGVKIGDTVTLVQGHQVRVVTVRALAQRRGPANEAQTLYDEHD